MIFHKERAIYLQLADRICEDILTGNLTDDDRVLSVRDYAALLKVNVNTVMKAYEYLARHQIIFNRRGMGYFVTTGAKERIHKERRSFFLSECVPLFVSEMQLLGISVDELLETIQSLKERVDEPKQKTAQRSSL